MAPISGTVLQMFPHAYIIVSADNVGVLVHLGLDTVQLKGEGFTAHVAKGDTVEAGQPVITYDVPSVVATGRNPIVPVVVMEKQPEDIRLDDVDRGRRPAGAPRRRCSPSPTERSGEPGRRRRVLRRPGSRRAALT